MPKLTSTAAILLVKDVVLSANYYKDKLGFINIKFYGNPINFAIAQRDAQRIMFSQADATLIKPNWKIADKTSNVFFWVDDIETLYKEFIDNGATIDYELYVAPWGGKEFGINDLDEYDITFGEIVNNNL